MNQKPHHRINVESLVFSNKRPSAKYSQQVSRTFRPNSVDGISRSYYDLPIALSKRIDTEPEIPVQKLKLHGYSSLAQDISLRAYHEVKSNLLLFSDKSVQHRTKNVLKKIRRYRNQPLEKRTSFVRLGFAGLFLFIGFGVGVFGTLFIDNHHQSGSVLSLSTTIDKGVNADDADVTSPVPQVGSVPRRIEIASIAVSADVRSVGITQAGAIAVTPRLNEVGWYKNSRAPGDGGTSVFVGHYNGDKPAVFQHLKDVQIGDQIVIERSDAVTVKYQVISSQIYDKQDVPMQDILSNGTDKALLKIITCEGLWLKNEHTYAKRLLVVAEQI